MSQVTSFKGVLAILLWSIAYNAWAGPASDEVILRTPELDAQFRRLGVDGSGAVIIIGDNQTSDYWRFFNDEFTHDALGDYMSERNVVTGISRDGRYAVGMTPVQVQGGDTTSGIVWPIATPSSPIMLPYVDGDRTTDTVAVASTNDGPAVIGRAIGGAFRWSPGAGYTLM